MVVYISCFNENYETLNYEATWMSNKTCFEKLFKESKEKIELLKEVNYVVNFKLRGIYSESVKRDFKNIVLETAVREYQWKIVYTGDYEKLKASPDYDMEKSIAYASLKNFRSDVTIDITEDYVLSNFTKFKSLLTERYKDIIPIKKIAETTKDSSCIREYFLSCNNIKEPLEFLKKLNLCNKPAYIDFILEKFKSSDDINQLLLSIPPKILLSSESFQKLVSKEEIKTLKISSQNRKNMEKTFFVLDGEIANNPENLKKKEKFLIVLSKTLNREYNNIISYFNSLMMTNHSFHKLLNEKDYQKILKLFPKQKNLTNFFAIGAGINVENLNPDISEELFLITEGDSINILTYNFKLISLRKIPSLKNTNELFLNNIKYVLKEKKVSAANLFKSFWISCVDIEWLLEMFKEEMKNKDFPYKEYIDRINYFTFLNKDTVSRLCSIVSTERLIENKIILKTLPDVMKRGSEYISSCISLYLSDSSKLTDREIILVKSLIEALSGLPDDDGLIDLVKSVKLISKIE